MEAPPTAVPTLADVRAHAAVDPRAANAEEAANVPRCPPRVIALAVCADLVLWLLDERPQDTGICLCLCLGLRLPRVRHCGEGRGGGKGQDANAAGEAALPASMMAVRRALGVFYFVPREALSMSTVECALLSR